MHFLKRLLSRLFGFKQEDPLLVEDIIAYGNSKFLGTCPWCGSKVASCIDWSDEYCNDCGRPIKWTEEQYNE